MDPPKSALCGSGGPCDPHPCLDMTLLQAGGSASAPLGVRKEWGGDGDGVQQVQSWGAALSGCPSPRWAG